MLTTTEVARLLACAPTPMARTVFVVAFGSGLRIGEVRTLRVEDIASAAPRRSMEVHDGEVEHSRAVR